MISQLEQEALEFFERMKNLYFVQRNSDGILRCMEENITWLGTGENEVGKGAAECKRIWDLNFGKSAPILTIVSQNMNTSVLSGELCLIYGSMQGRAVNCGEAGPVLHVTAVCRRTKSGMKLVHCNVSCPDSMGLTDRRMKQEELRLSLERHEIIMDQTTDIIFEWNIAEDTLLFSPNWRKKFGYDPIRTQISSKIPRSKNIHPDDISAFVKIMDDIKVGIPYSETEFRIQDSAGKFIWSKIRATGQLDSMGRPIKAVGVIVDISTQKRERQELLERASRDALTGLYNKAAIRTVIERYMTAEGAEGKQAMIIIDIDHFKEVNDNYGHPCGDAVLTDVSNVLCDVFRECGIIGRIGGDEFLVYLPEAESEEAVKEKTAVALMGISMIRPAQEAPPISCSAGAALFLYGDADYLSLYQFADCALYHRKNNGRDGISFYDPTTM